MTAKPLRKPMMPVRLRILRAAVLRWSTVSLLILGLAMFCEGSVAPEVSLLAAAQEPSAATHAAAGDAGPHGAAAEHSDGEHEESLGSFLSRLGNFALLAGGLVYFLRKPLSEYLASRGEQISRDLVTAAELKATATAQLAEIDHKLKLLPAELEALKQRGAEEVKAEEARIRADAEKDRARLLEQADREIGMRVQTARRDLTELAAELAVTAAKERLRRETSDADQLRLIDRYVSQVRTMHE